MVFKIFDFWLELSPLPYFYEKMLVIAMVKAFLKKSHERENMYLNTFFIGKNKNIAGTYLSAMHAKQLRCESIYLYFMVFY